MSNDEFVNEYEEIVKRILNLAEKAKNEGFLSLEEMIDKDKYHQREIIDLGLRLVIDGTDSQFINKILTNIVNLETDTDRKILKTIEKEGILGIQEGLNRRLLLILLNSYVNVGIEDTMKQLNEEI